MEFPGNLNSRPRSITRLVLPGLLLATACLFPFLSKAFTIDDPLFLLESRQIIQTPLQPWSFPVCWMGDETCLVQAGGLGANAREGLMGYVLLPVVIANGAEWMAHLLQIVLAWLAVWAMVRLALRLQFGRVQTAVAGVFLVVIPPFLSMASTAMPDILALALALIGIERVAAWKDERKLHQAIAAGMALGVAPYARPHAALFLPLAALWVLDDFGVRKAVAQLQGQLNLWTPVLIGALVLFAVNFLTRQRNAGYEPKNMLLGTEHIAPNLIAYFHYLSFPIPLAAVWLSVNWRRSKVLLVLPAVLIAVLYGTLTSSIHWLMGLQMAAVLCGIVAIVDLIWSNLVANDRVGVLLSLWVLMPLPAVIYLHLPIKYMLAVSPAIVLLLIRTLGTVSQTRRILGCGAVILGCLIYSLVLLRADADFAEYGRRASAELIAPRVAAGERVWFSGQWGLYWYAQRAGANVSKPGEPGPNPGELLVVGLMEGGDVALKRFPNRELVDLRSYASPHGRTMGYGAGLYSNAYGILPWRWNPSAANVYEVWRIH